MNAARAALALALALLAGCDLGLGSDPDRGAGELPSCAAGHVRAGEGPCLLPVATLTVDGVVDDWAGIEAIAVDASCDGATCDGPEPIELQVAIGPGGEGPGGEPAPDRLFLRVRFAGEPADPPGRSDRLLMEPPPGSVNRVVDAIAFGAEFAATPAYYRAGRLSLIPTSFAQFFALAATADGYEAWVSVNFLLGQDSLQLRPTVWWQGGGYSEVAPVIACFAEPLRDHDPCEVAP